jgi:hypothetical protein
VKVYELIQELSQYGAETEVEFIADIHYNDQLLKSELDEINETWELDINLKKEIYVDMVYYQNGAVKFELS